MLTKRQIDWLPRPIMALAGCPKYNIISLRSIQPSTAVFPPPPLSLPQTPRKKNIYPEWAWKECPLIYPDIIRSAVHKVLTVSTHWSNAGHVLARLVKFPTLNLQRSDLERKIRIYKRMKSTTALDFPSEDHILKYDWKELSPWTNTVNLWLGSKLTYSVPMVGEVQFTTQEQQKPFFS